VTVVAILLVGMPAVYALWGIENALVALVKLYAADLDARERRK
jgi:hypothetical protein